MSVDVRGLPITVANDVALSAYECAVAGFMAQKRDTMDRLDAALDADPEFVMAHCFKANLLKMAFDPAFQSKAHDSLEIAKRPRSTQPNGSSGTWPRLNSFSPRNPAKRWQRSTELPSTILLIR